MKVFMCVTIVLVIGAWANQSRASSVAIAAVLNPAGDFVAKTEQVTGSAYKTAKGVAAENIVVDLRNLKTGIELRDKHTKEHLEVGKYPTAKLIKATGENGKGSADFEIRGTKVHSNGDYKIVGSNIEATFKIHLPDVKIANISYHGLGVEDDVTVTAIVPLLDKPPGGAAPAAKVAPKKK